MDINRRRLWMDNRNFPERRGLRPSFVAGVMEFLDVARNTDDYLRHGKIRCPCEICECVKIQDLENVELHLYKKGFMPNYYIWYNHGEPWDMQQQIQNLKNIHGARSSPVVEPDQAAGYRMEDMVNDAFGMYPANDPLQPDTSQPNIEHIPNAEANKFYERLEETSRPFYEGSVHSQSCQFKLKAWEKATKALEDWTATQQSECGSSTPVPVTLEQETNLWLEAVGGVKKGSAYGIGTLYSSAKHKSNYLGSCSSAPPSSAPAPEMTRMQAEIEELRKQNEAMRLAQEAHQREVHEMMRASQEAHQREMHEMMQEILRNQRKGKGKRDSSGKGKSKSRHSHHSPSQSDAGSSSASSH